VTCQETENNFSFENQTDLQGNFDVICRIRFEHHSKPIFPENVVFDNVTILVASYQIKFAKIPNHLNKIFPNLKSVFFSSTGVKEVEKKHFSGLGGLIKLRIQNGLANIEKGSFDDLVEVLYLQLDYNELTSLPKNIFDKMEKLQELSLNNNRLKSLDVDLFKNNVNVVLLDLTLNELTSVESGMFKSLTKLIKLQLEANKMTHIHQDLLKNNIKLETFTMDDNNITEIPHDFFQSTSGLKKFMSGNNPLTKLDFSIFDYTKTIEHISLPNTQIKEITNIDVVDKLTSLKKINFANAFEASCIMKTYDIKTGFQLLKEDAKANCTIV
jgi:Leucine-rich repeat (LRR) protein